MNLDPQSVVIGAALVECTKIAIQSARGVGKKWLENYKVNQLPAAQLKAAERTDLLLDKFASRLEQMEQQQQLNTEVINRALEEPSFGSVLCLAMTQAANTDDEAKHELLSRLVADKLTAEQDSTEGNIIPLACHAIGHVTHAQLATLVVRACMVIGVPVFSTEAAENEDAFHSECDTRVYELLAPILGIPISHDDILHLEAVSCLKCSLMAHPDIDQPWKCGRFELSTSKFRKLPSVVEASKHWNGFIWSTNLTTVGECLAMYVMHQAGLSVNDPEWRAPRQN